MAHSRHAWMKAREVEEMFAREEPPLMECPDTPKAGDTLRFRRLAGNDTTHLCDKYRTWHSCGACELEYGIRRNYYQLKPYCKFFKSVSIRGDDVLVEYLGDSTSAGLRAIKPTSKHLLQQVDLFESDQDNLKQLRGLSVKQIQNAKYRMKSKLEKSSPYVDQHLADHTYCVRPRFQEKLPLKTKFTTLETFLISQNNSLPNQILDEHLRCLELTEWLSMEVVDKMCLQFCKHVVPGQLWNLYGKKSQHLLHWLCRMKIPLHTDEPIFVPMSEHQHFFLGIISRSHIFLLDSLYHTEETHKQLHTKMMHKMAWMAAVMAFVNAWPSTPTAHIIATDFTKQKDSTECGVIVILSTLSVLMAWEFPEPTTIIEQRRNRAFLLNQFQENPKRNEGPPLKSISTVQRYMKKTKTKPIEVTAGPVRALLKTLLKQ